jgi:hypothetical protein
LTVSHPPDLPDPPVQIWRHNTGLMSAGNCLISTQPQA